MLLKDKFPHIPEYILNKVIKNISLRLRFSLKSTKNTAYKGIVIVGLGTFEVGNRRNTKKIKKKIQHYKNKHGRKTRRNKIDENKII